MPGRTRGRGRGRSEQTSAGGPRVRRLVASFDFGFTQSVIVDEVTKKVLGPVSFDMGLTQAVSLDRKTLLGSVAMNYGFDQSNVLTHAAPFVPVTDTITTVASDNHTVRTGWNTLRIRVWGPGGGGNGCNQSASFTQSPDTAGACTVTVGSDVLSAGGATRATPGVASGGDINTNGNAALGDINYGTVGSGVNGRAGANAPNGGTGGNAGFAPGSGTQSGTAGTAPGAGGGGAADQTVFQGTGPGAGGAGGHSGAYVEKTYTFGVGQAPAYGALLPYVMRAGGLAGAAPSLGFAGSAGARSQIEFIYN